ncbi:MAG: DUF4249 domain-containing protein [Rhodothermia bacterium]|nr:DUF4249 domain-containing protein [Rhodothermia bacterium]
MIHAESYRFLPVPTVLVIVACGMIAACDTGVDRFSDAESDFAFNVSGAIATESDTQFVRVQRIRNTVEPLPGDLNAVVTLSETNSGRAVTMTDSLVSLGDGNIDHLLFAVFDVSAGFLYRLRIEGTDGDIATATTTVPDKPSLAVAPATVVGARTTQAVSWNGLTKTPENAVVFYRVARSEAEQPQIVEFPYTLRGRLVRDGWIAELRLSDDLRIVRQQLEIPQDDDQAVFHGVSMRLRIPSPEWSGGLEGRNIEGGVGFFGSVGVFTERWNIGEGAIDNLGFINGQQ